MKSNFFGKSQIRNFIILIIGSFLIFGYQNCGDVRVVATGLKKSDNRIVDPDSVLNFLKISSGSYHTCAISESGQAYCWGENYAGQLGLGEVFDSSLPARVSSSVNFQQIESDTDHMTCGLSIDGEVYCWGEGYLGAGENISSSASPLKVLGLPHVKQISVGGSTVCAVSVSHQVYCWGRNNSGQIGNGTQLDSYAPILVQGLSDVKQVDVSAISTCAVTNSNKLYCWGSNIYGFMGNGLSGPSQQQLVPVQNNLVSNVDKVSVGEAVVCILDLNGKVYCWGDNHQGTVGNGEILPIGAGPILTPYQIMAEAEGDFRDISTRGYVACALRVQNNNLNGSLYCWGTGGWGQLGQGNNLNSAYPQMVSDISNVNEISVGSSHVCAIAENQVYCWGSNGSRECGYSHVENSNLPIPIQLPEE